MVYILKYKREKLQKLETNCKGKIIKAGNQLQIKK